MLVETNKKKDLKQIYNILLKHMVKEMSGWGNVLMRNFRSGKFQLGKCPVGGLSVRGNIRRGSVLGEVPVGELCAY